MRPGPKVLARRVGAIVVMLLALGPAAMTVAPSAQASTTVAARYEARLLYLINGTRVWSGRGGLRLTSCPLAFSSRWANYLAGSGYFFHQSLYPVLRVCHATTAAENLARGHIGADGIMSAWMNSPGHRANILDRRLTRIGVTAVYAHGAWTVAADFTRS